MLLGLVNSACVAFKGVRIFSKNESILQTLLETRAPRREDNV